MIKNLQASKKGVASLYVVIFATILFGVITLSFIRIILSETDQANKDDLSQSAYDSAMAGVEDAKRAVNLYYKCQSNPSASGCNEVRNRQLFDGDCDNFPLKTYLYGDTYPGEVLVQESVSNNSDQAYTCVILKNVVADYRSTLTSDTRTRVVPLGIGSNNLSDVKEIKFQWYSEVNGTKFKNLNTSGTFANKTNTSVPPVISLSLIKTGANINLDDFNNSTADNFSTMVFLPSESENAINVIDQSIINAAANSDQDNSPFLIKCQHEEFACTVNLTGLNFANGGNAMLVVSMPYGDIITDFAVTLKKSDGSSIDFTNVQVSVDSTGRANQLVRRVETRLDPADIFFPYPQYAVELGGGDADVLKKFFWITANCWTEGGNCANNGELSK